MVGPGGRVTRIPNGNSYNNDEDDGIHSDDDAEDLEGGNFRERRGFDRLRAAGLSRQEITALRSYFNRHVDRYIEQQQEQNNNNSAGTDSSDAPTLHLDEPDLRRRRLLVEEEWMVSQGPASEFRLNLNQNTLLRFAALSGGGSSATGIRTATARVGNDRDFLWGFCLGFFVGFISLVWVWMPTIPHKQKVGILCGLFFQLAMEVTHKDMDDKYGEDVFASNYDDGD